MINDVWKEDELSKHVIDALACEDVPDSPSSQLKAAYEFERQLGDLIRLLYAQKDGQELFKHDRVTSALIGQRISENTLNPMGSHYARRP